MSRPVTSMDDRQVLSGRGCATAGQAGCSVPTAMAAKYFVVLDTSSEFETVNILGVVGQELSFVLEKGNKSMCLAEAWRRDSIEGLRSERISVYRIKGTIGLAPVVLGQQRFDVPPEFFIVVLEVGDGEEILWSAHTRRKTAIKTIISTKRWNAQGCRDARSCKHNDVSRSLEKFDSMIYRGVFSQTPSSTIFDLENRRWGCGQSS